MALGRYCLNYLKEVGVADKFWNALKIISFIVSLPVRKVTSGNVISVHGFRILQDVYAKVKDSFNEIDNLLPRISIDKDETNY